MLTITIREALDDNFYIDTADHFLYLYKDEDTIFYVGRALSPLDRLEGHMGKGRGTGSQLGDIIRDNLPASLDWTMQMFTLGDCTSLVSPSSRTSYAAILQEGTMLTRLCLYELLADDAERGLINHYQPCLNAKGKWYSKQLPERYADDAKIANEGIKLSR